MEGKIKWKAFAVDGLENAAEAVKRLFTGDHDGKLLIRISAEP
jgi:NADPH-dependent curcumin reductase CurA